MKTVITKRINFHDHKFWVSVNFFKEGPKCFHALYLHFKKSDFPAIKPPPFLDGRFDYYASELSELNWHGGCTFYEETTVNNGHTYVKIGCDYCHLDDDMYMSCDSSESILTRDGKAIANEFINKYCYTGGSNG